MKKIILLFVALFLLINFYSKTTLAQEVPNLRVGLSENSPRVVLLRRNVNDQVVVVWRLTNLSNERMVVNNISVRARGLLNQIDHLSFNILADGELRVEYDEHQGDEKMFFKDVYIVLAPGQSKDVSLVVKTDNQIVSGNLFLLSVNTLDFDGFSTSSINIRAVGNFPINSSLIATIGRR